MIYLLLEINAGDIDSHAFYEIHERQHRIRGATVEFVAGGRACGPPHGATIGAGVRTHRLDSPGTYAASRAVDYTFERGVVIPVRDQPQVRKRVFDLGALEEPESTVHAIRNTRVDQRFLEHS